MMKISDEDTYNRKGKLSNSTSPIPSAITSIPTDTIARTHILLETSCFT